MIHIIYDRIPVELHFVEAWQKNKSTVYIIFDQKKQTVCIIFKKKQTVYIIFEKM